MNKPARKIEWLVWGALVLTIAGIAVAYVFTQLHARGTSGALLPLSYSLPDFTLTNQDNRPVSLAGLRGQVWVADIIFTRCAGPCPRLTRQMREVQDASSAGDSVKLVSLTTNPEYDTPEVLRRYAERAGAKPGQWLFLTGERAQIKRLAIDGLKLIAQEKKPETRESAEDLFIHSTLFVVVDRQGRLRGSFESDDPDWKPKVLTAVKILSREP